MTIKEIDARIAKTLKLLEKHQANDGGFKLLVKLPKSPSGDEWLEERQNAFMPANILIPLTCLGNNPTARKILHAGYSFLNKNRSTQGFWHYFDDKKVLDREYPGDPYFIPFETDTNSLLSYVGTVLHKKVLDKKLFYKHILPSGYFNLWFLPYKSLVVLNPLYFLDILIAWFKANKYPAFKHNLVNKDDAEFCVSSNIMLFTGENPLTKSVSDKLISDVMSEVPIKLIYYPNQTIAYYLFCRAYYYGNNPAFANARNVLGKKIDALIRTEVCADEYLNIIAASTILFMNISAAAKNSCIENCWNLYDRIEYPFVFYCSNSYTDINTETKINNSYFGSVSLTISLYIEFLTLLKKELSGINQK